MQFSLEQNLSTPWKRYEVKVFDDAWFTIARVSSDSPWFLSWLEEMLKTNPPLEIKNVASKQN